MHPKLMAGLVIAVMIVGVAIWTIWKAPERAFGFPSAIGQSLIYDHYQEDDKLSAETLTVTEKVQFQGVECFKVEISADVEFVNFVVSGYSLVDINSKSRRDCWLMRAEERIYDYDGNKIHAKVTKPDGSTIENEFNMPSDYFSMGRYYWGFSKEDLYVGYSKQFSTISSVDISADYINIAFTTATASVVREENVTVPAGTSACYVLEISMEGTEKHWHIWVDRQMSIVVQFEIDGILFKLKNYSGF